MLLRALSRATSRIGENYFLLPIAGRDLPVARERVYCYELFHQLRLALGDTRLTLTAEPDKRGHPDFPPCNPDFILHAPGRHDQNTAVIEVECRPDLRHITKDLRTLQVMRERGYRTLVLLLFAIERVPWRSIERASHHSGLDLEDFEVVLHRRPGEAATVETPLQAP